MIAFDISSSMLAEDFQPQNRLEVARDLVRKFVALRTNDRLGLVAFSGEALTQVPLTTDELDKLTALVRESIGFKQDRGDSVTVINAPFKVDAVTSHETPFWKSPELIDLIRAAALPVGLGSNSSRCGSRSSAAVIPNRTLIMRL